MDDATVEAIARRWCALTGEDANRLVDMPNTGEIATQRPYWHLVALEIVPMFAWLRVYLEFMSGKDASKVILPN
jgi:hypothetical protein